MKQGWMTAGLVAALAGGAVAASPVMRPAPIAAESAALPTPAPAVTPALPSATGDLTDPLQPPHEADAAPVALLVDLGSGRTLFARNADQRFLPASVTKVMTAYTAFDLLSQGRLKPDQLLTVSDDAWQAWHAKGSRMFLARASQVSVDNLLMGITTVSANDGCIVLAEGAAGSVDNWVALMNAEARKLGMTGSHFGTPNGWMDGGNTYYTAHDLALLANAMITRFPAYYHRYIGHKQLTWNGITQANHDPTLGIVPGADGIKTGFTNEAHYTFVGSAERGGRRLVVVLAAVPTAPERARAARALLGMGVQRLGRLSAVRCGGDDRYRRGPAGRCRIGRAGGPARLFRDAGQGHRCADQPACVLPGAGDGADRQGRAYRRSRNPCRRATADASAAGCSQ